jgi:hypothetical protein
MDVLETRLPQHLDLQRGGLRLIGDISIAVVVASLLIGPVIITIIIFRPCRSIIGVGGGIWGRVDSSRSSRGFDVDSLLLMSLLLFIRVVEDDDIVVAKRLEDVTVEVAKKFLGELHVTRSVSDEVFLIWR